ncbi:MULTISPECIES: IS66 family insertion sequence element accessory protein TnpB [unclassified Bradyrhizobium]|uniref:IS66 family insertion sequence element accessory protein TnpB n=1 Tax=unclassified Bradyrhizobium TaxID=2631580 RepID=UPI00230539D1|nr:MULTISPECIES: IS66 family insertion sequence element accessory protein TnpB [unclassified Bradyrhizobium]
MIPIPSGVRVWIATGHTDMRRGMRSLALTVQESLKRDPHGGDLYIFRGRSGDLVKILWHDGLGMSLYAKRLDRGKFIWPSASDGAISISAAQMAYMLEGIIGIKMQCGHDREVSETHPRRKRARHRRPCLTRTIDVRPSGTTSDRIQCAQRGLARISSGPQV